MKGRSRFLALALAACALAVGAAAAVAATSGSGNVIKACVNNRTGALFLSKNGRCGKGRHRLSWNQHGPPGAPGTPGRNGTNGMTNITTRSGTLTIPQACTAAPPGGLPFNCTSNGPASATVSCHPGEHATGGGFSGDAVATESRPNPTTGTPTGWTVTANGNVGYTEIPVVYIPVTIYVVCVS